MKKILSKIVGLTVVGLFSNVNAGVVTGTDIIDGSGNDIIITDNAGNALVAGTGFVSLGYFGSLSDVDVAGGMTASQFKTTIGDFSSVTANPPIDEGMYLETFDYGTGTLDAQAGKTWYSLIGNAADVNSSTMFILYKHDDVIVADGSTPTPAAPELLLNDGSLMYGVVDNNPITVDASNLLGNANYTSSLSFGMDLVPEPSSTALLGLGVFAFALRRRR